ncbi:MAG: arylsulfatase [Sedimentisphaerales bacterium]
MSEQTRREFLKAVGTTIASARGLSILAGCAGIGQTTVAERKRPNIILIITDDQGWGDIHSHGNDLIDTPVLNRLAADGPRFDRFFVSSVCAPTRASLLTGRYYLRTGTHGVTRGYENMRSEEVTIAEALKQAGYVTGCFGKWHNGAHYPCHPNGQGFDEFFGFCGGHWNNYFDTTLEQNGQPVKTKGYITDVLTRAVLSFIETHRKKPFFCYVPYNAPHSPFQVPDKYFNKYKARGLDDKLACIYAMCENLDDNIERILKRLDELALSNNTIVLFLTDNGPNSDRYNGGMKSRKGSVHEGGVRVPLFIRWPGHIKPGTTISQIAAHIDLFPTILELCGVPMPKTLPQDGVSLAALLKEETASWPDRMIFTFRSGRGDTIGARGAVRTQRWRAVKVRKEWELYDMQADPGQKHNISTEYPDVVKKLGAAYEAAVRDVTKAGFEPLAIHIGYPQWPVVTLPGHEAFLEPPSRKAITYKGRSGWANDWITNWTSTEAYPWWPVEVVRPGRFEVTLMYTCPQQNLGAKVRVEIGGKSLEGVVSRAHDPEPIPSPDRVPRGEVYEKIWAPLTLGAIELTRGRTKLVVKAVQIPGSRAFDLKAVQLRRLN